MPFQNVPGLSVPGYIADPQSIRRTTGKQIGWASVPASYRSTAQTITLTANAAQNATTLAVAALPVALAIGEKLYFSGAGKFAMLTAPAAAGATSLTVEAIPTAMSTGNKAIVGGGSGSIPPGYKAIAGGKIMSKLADGTIVPRDSTSSTATEILLESCEEGMRSASLSGVGTLVGGVLFKELLPDAVSNSGSLATWLAELATAGCTFQFETYADTRAA